MKGYCTGSWLKCQECEKFRKLPEQDSNSKGKIVSLTFGRIIYRQSQAAPQNIQQGRSRRTGRSNPTQQAAQKGHPTRPQASHNRRRTLSGTLRIVTNRERSWGPFSAACLKEGHAGVSNRRIVLIGDPAVVAEDLPTLRFDQPQQGIDG